MTRDVNEAVRAIIAETFDVPVDVVTDDTVADDIDGWDSLSHTVLMIRIQNAFGIHIPEAVAAEAATVGELSAAVAEIAEMLDPYDADPGHVRQLTVALEKGRARIAQLERQRADIEAALAELKELETIVVEKLRARGVSVEG